MQDERRDARKRRSDERLSLNLGPELDRMPVDEQEERREEKDRIECKVRREREEKGGLDGRACGRGIQARISSRTQARKSDGRTRHCRFKREGEKEVGKRRARAGEGGRDGERVEEVAVRP